MPGFFFFHYGIHQSCVKLLKMFLRIFFPTKLFAISCNFASPQIHFSIRFDKIAALYFFYIKNTKMAKSNYLSWFGMNRW